MANQTIPKPMIFANDGPLSGTSWVLNSETIIGRDPTCDVQIFDRQVSRKHAKIETGNNSQAVIFDLDSKNGVYLNGDRIKRSAKIKDGDAIKIALIQELIFVSSDATIPLDIATQLIEEPSQRLYIDKSARRVWIGDEELLPPLSVQQYKLLTLLYEANSAVVARQEIINVVWGGESAFGVSEQALDALVRRLRDRLFKKDPTHAYIKTIRGVGFLFENTKFKD